MTCKLESSDIVVKIPKAFSVRDEREFAAFGHLMSRLSPELKVSEIACGLHVNGGGTVFWGLVYKDKPNRSMVMEALVEAGFDQEHNGAILKWE